MCSSSGGSGSGVCRVLFVEEEKGWYKAGKCVMVLLLLWW